MSGTYRTPAVMMLIDSTIKGECVVGLITYWLGGPHPNYYLHQQFADNATFFRWLCRYGETRVRLKKPMIARVASLEDPTAPLRSGFGADPMMFDPGYQPMKVVVPARDGRGRVVAATKISGSPNLKDGDMVGIIPLHRADLFGQPWWHSAVVAKMHAATGEHGPLVETYY